MNVDFLLYRLQMILHSVLSTRAVLHLSSTSSQTLHGGNPGSLTDYKFTTMIFSDQYTPDTVDSGDTSGTSTSGGAYTMTATMTDGAASPVSVGSQDIEMGFMRMGEGGRGAEREVGGGGGGSNGGCGEGGVVLEVPRIPLSPGFPLSPTLVDVHLGEEGKS